MEIVMGIIFIVLVFAFVVGFLLFPEIFGISKEKDDREKLESKEKDR